MRRGLSLLLLSSFALAACDQVAGLAGVSSQKETDAKAIGYACRFSQKAPEDCMKENESQSPSSILTGWKLGDKEIHDKVIDPRMGAIPPASAPAVVPCAPVPAPPAAAQAKAANTKK